MASITSRSVTRFVASIHTTPTLRRSVPVRTIVSFKGLQSLAEPGKVPSEEVKKDNFMSQHLEALSFWHEESEKMRTSMIFPPGEEIYNQANLSEQVVELLEDLVDVGVLDARTGWLAAPNL